MCKSKTYHIIYTDYYIRPPSLQSWGLWGSLEYTSIVSQSVQEDTGNIWTCRFYEVLRCP